MKTKMELKAEDILSYNEEFSTLEMIQLIKNNVHPNELIDYIDGVQTNEDNEFKYTCSEFMDYIGDDKN